MTDAAATVHCHACGLVDHQQMIVFEHGVRLEPCTGRTDRGAGLFRGAHGRQAHAVARLDPVVRPDTPAVDAHFAAAQDAVDVALRYAFELARQVVVDALAGRVRADFMPTRGN